MQRLCRLLIFLIATLATLGGGGIASAADSIGYFAAIKSDTPPTAGKHFYTRHCFMYSRGSAETINYWFGDLVPINTPVTLVSLFSKSMILRLPNGREVEIENVKKFSGEEMSTIARNLLATQRVPLDQFDEATAKAIKEGEVKMGMTKEQVIMARGYPPKRRTPSLDGDIWIYWTSHYIRRRIEFRNGVVIKGPKEEETEADSTRWKP